MSLTIEEAEERDGIRLTWNIWPVSPSKLEIVPIACLYTVLQPTLQVDYEPIYCHNCQGIICPQAIIDYNSLTWICALCQSNNILPQRARQITGDNTLQEIQDQNTTIEYTLNKTSEFAPVFIFLIDRCTYDEERHKLMIKGLRKMIDLIPDDSRVGIIEFGTNIELLTFTDEKIQTIYTMPGNRIYQQEDIDRFGLSDLRTFLPIKSERYSDILKAIHNLEPDPFPIPNGMRQMRCTGSALSFSMSLAERIFRDCPVKHMVFTQGGCTYGPGKVTKMEISPVSEEKVDTAEAEKIYLELGERLNLVGHAIDMISETIADIGIEYFKPIITLSGGTLIMAQDFDEEIKMKSIEKLMERRGDGSLRQCFNAKIQVKTSGNLAFKSILGDGKAVGSGWRVGSLMESTNLTILLENTATALNNAYGCIQIISQYYRSNRLLITRVTTITRFFSDSRQNVCMGFDQEASCVFQARAFLQKGFKHVLDFESSIDKNLIRFIRRYGNYERNNHSSVYLPDSMAYYPNFMFFFRRSLLVQKDGISRDESVYFHILLNKIPPGDAIKMIKPSLIAFHYHGDVQPVELDTSSLNPESILVLDTFHNILVWRGLYVDNWIKEGLHEKPEYEIFKTVISEVNDYSRSLMNRLPVPQFKETCEGRSQARILLHYVNPSQQGAVNSEKIDFSRFYDTLCRYIVKSD